MATLIQKLFKPKWQHAKAEVRLSALASLDDQTVLLQLAQHDPDEQVQLAALKKLQDPDQLIGFFNHSATTIKDAALKRFLTTLLGFEQTQDQIKSLASLNESQRLMQIATYADDETLRQAALNQIQDEASLYDFILASPSAKARHIAAQRIERADYLDNLQKVFKGKDKSLVKLAKEKRQVQLQQAQAEAEAQAAVQKILDQAEHLSTAAFSPTYAAQLAHLKQSWPKLASTTSEQNTRFETLIKQAESVLEANKAQAEALEQAKQLQQAAQQKQQACISALLDALDNIKQTNKADLNTVSELIKQQQHDWLESEKQQKAHKTDSQSFEAAIKSLYQVETCLTWIAQHENDIEQIKQQSQTIDGLSLNQLVKLQKNAQKYLSALSWPQDLPALPITQLLAQVQTQAEARINKIRQDEKNQLGKVEQLMDALEQAIQAGHIKDAKRQQKLLGDTLSNISDDKAKGFAARKHLLQAQLQELMDWQGFATVPKMEELCAAMEALIDSGKSADVLADEINLLQQEWKTLGGGDRKTTQQLWERFKAAADKAYEPCREHFHQQSEERQINKEKREQLCQQLEQFVEQNDWQQTDWKTIPVLCDKARGEWKSYSPVDRRDHKVLQERFNQVISVIRGKLTEEYERNAQQKQALIDQVIQLLDKSDLSEAIEQCKQVQEQWKSIPQAGRKDFALWKEFRAQCDALFSRRDEEKNQRKAAIDEAIQEAEALLQQAKEIATSNETQVPVKRAGVAEAQQAFAKLQVPKRVYERIRNEFQNIEQQLNQQAEQAKTQAEKQLWQNALTLSQALAVQETQGQVDEAALESLKVQIDETPLPSQAASVLNQRLSNLSNGQQQSEGNSNASAANIGQEQTLLDLCLELEITMGLDSPAQDKDARMALQVTLLQSRMGQGAIPRHEQKADLTCRWLAQPATASNYEQYCQRFTSALERV